MIVKVTVTVTAVFEHCDVYSTLLYCIVAHCTVGDISVLYHIVLCCILY
jgi:hypothetical protein